MKAKLVSKLEQWPFSNYLEFIEKRKGSLCDPVFIQTYFADPAEYHHFVYDETVEPPSGFDDDILN